MRRINKRKMIITIIIIAILVVAIGMLIRIPIIKQLISIVFISFIVSYILKPIYMILINKGINKK